MSFLNALIGVSLLISGAAAQQPQTSERVVLAGAAKVERIDISTRTVTLRGENNQMFAVYVDPSMKVFNELKTGDTVRVRVVDAVVVNVVRNARPTVVTDTTAEARKANPDGPEVLQQLKAVVTIESIDLKAQTVVYKTADNRSVTRYAVDPHLLEGVKKGDVVELTYRRERAVELEKR